MNLCLSNWRLLASKDESDRFSGTLLGKFGIPDNESAFQHATNTVLTHSRDKRGLTFKMPHMQNIGKIVHNFENESLIQSNKVYG